jgi:hypothetical protein
MVEVAAHTRSRVVVEREIVGRLSDHIEITRLDQRFHFGSERLGIATVDLRIGKGTVPQSVEHDCGDLVLLAVGYRLARVEIVDVADQEIGALRPHRLDPEAVREVHDMDRFEPALPAADGVIALGVAFDVTELERQELP